MIKYCLSVNNGNTWEIIAGRNLNDAKQNAQRRYPVALYGPVHRIGVIDTDDAQRKVRVVAERKPHFNKRSTWYNLV